MTSFLQHRPLEPSCPKFAIQPYFSFCEGFVAAWFCSSPRGRGAAWVVEIHTSSSEAALWLLGEQGAWSVKMWLTVTTPVSPLSGLYPACSFHHRWLSRQQLVLVLATQAAPAPALTSWWHPWASCYVDFFLPLWSCALEPLACDPTTTGAVGMWHSILG